MRHILIVEDDRLSRESLASLMRAAGHEVKVAYSAEDACTIMKSFTPDIVLLDIRLPGMFGDTFGLYLRRRYPRVKIVFVTAERLLDHPERYGPQTEFLRKPVDSTRLLTSVAG